MPIKIIKVDERNVNEINNLKKGKATVLFYHPGCIHCVMMREPWESMKKKLNRRNVEGNIYEVDGQSMSNINHPVCRAVQGFPTLLNVNKGKITSFEKERNFKNILNFILSNIKNKKSKKVRFTNRLVNNITLNKERLLKKKSEKKKTQKKKTQKKVKTKKGKK